MTAPAHFTVLDTAFSEERLQRLIDTYRSRAERLHVVALAPHLLPGWHRMLRGDGVTVDLLSARLAQAVPELSLRIDALCLDGIGEEGEGWARQLSKLCVPGAQLATGGLTPGQVRAVTEVGFRFDEAQRSATFASRKPQPPAPPARERRAVVVGAGLAGSAACERLVARGWDVTLVERHPLPASEASGNLAGIFMPLLSRDDNIPTRLTRAAYLFALRYFDYLGNGFLGGRCGVLQVARDAAHARVQREIAAKFAYPSDFARWIERDELAAMLGFAAAEGGWLFPQAGWARPSSVCEAMLEKCGERLTRRFNTGSVRIDRRGGEWTVTDAQGAVVAQAPTLVLASGAGALEMEQTAPLPLARVRGQVTHLEAKTAPNLPFVLCREAYMTPAVEGVVSTGATYDDIADPLLLPSSHHENIRKARSLLGDPQLGSDAPLAGRVGFRCIPPDRLPLVGALPDYGAGDGMERLRDVPRHEGLFGLLGYASRGLIWAPYAAEVLAAMLEGEPVPLENKLARALDPARFLLAGRKR
ncbi:FAD-dependent 5-carboxymethylaminomethyl-2-thiouridine(34) oxidoreductase MnmC [Pseudoduganella sp. GCM10020061]|uniref:FAD-dependent 5-carboxymethylaminomethyl-2-thiouridine(34) oxidoreductase MnmC n=1 Tax=Pseudoduganella sp. GCM10020061 TaxID=3317345 RepID=UPI003642BCF1